ncbi:MAG: hypothetical protein O7F76_13435, partial [Planctomycetota bacterium]|nr:hypothetical protein [Planctomycetota bacterium]
GFLARFRETLEYAGLAPSESDEIPESDQNARKRIGPRLPPNAREDVFGLSEGDVVLQYPARLSQESFEDLRDWLQIEIRKIRRLVRR